MVWIETLDSRDKRLEHRLKVSVFNQCMELVDQGLLSLEEAKLADERVLCGEPMFAEEDFLALESLVHTAQS